ncbi:hypothetical protein DQ244_10890 [Blastococcus sp. TBT05-19]|uniref:hypothetical protein n=1 Tax=Blastococcus sp. TBT05-19 TaxID=2250581 RepID=UPI000DE94998|nr:hypothetical protein [Blastococcus sp. TBT05-19]RBY91783.1 hypothetical protein DQ244_10890 [Blastococcus sp. TBT05-19]
MATVAALDPPATTVAPGPRRRWLDGLGWATPGALVGALVAYVSHEGLIDDVYITLGYVQNLAADLHWGLIPTETTNTATSPLNVVLLALATALVRVVTGELRPVVGLGLLTVVLSAAMSLWAARAARGLGISPAWSLAVLALVFANPFVNSSIGMEVLLTAALMTGLLDEAVRGRRVAFGVFAGLLVLTRLDIGVVVAAVFLLTPALRRRLWVSPLVGLAVAFPWFAFSWWFLGSAIPTSFVIKTLQRSFGDITFANGWLEFWSGDQGPAVSMAVVPALIGVLVTAVLLVVGLRRRLPAHVWPVAGLGVGGLAHFGAYCLLHVPPYHWYYVPSTVALGLTALLGLALLLRRVRSDRPGGVPAHAAPVLVAALVAGLAVVTVAGRGFPWTHPVIFGNWALPPSYLELGEEVGELVGDGTVASTPEIGTVAYACDCSVVDVFSDPGLAVPLIQERIDQASPVTRFILRANFYRLDFEDQPRELDYRLVWQPGVVEVPEGLPSWETYAPGYGPATVWLERIP